VIEVLAPGLLTTVQDRGRHGFAHLGVACGGAADPVSYALADKLAGNSGTEAALELTLKGPELCFSRDLTFAVTGADFAPTLDGRSVEMWRTQHARRGQTLSFTATKSGARAYLGLHGGIDVPVLLGSRSTLVNAGFGGFEGRALRRGDILLVGAQGRPGGNLVSRYRVTTADITPLRFLPGIAWDRLPPKSREAFAGAVFTVSEHSNRGGLRLESEVLAIPAIGEELSEGTLWGTVQLPPSGKPIVLMNEQGTTGGYPKIAQVILSDRGVLGQLKPRDRVRFVAVTMAEASKLWRERARDEEVVPV
jgi:biotin-dependent carboxylase-like uncharacterized protein